MDNPQVWALETIGGSFAQRMQVDESEEGLKRIEALLSGLTTNPPDMSALQTFHAWTVAENCSTLPVPEAVRKFIVCVQAYAARVVCRTLGGAIEFDGASFEIVFADRGVRVPLDDFASAPARRYAALKEELESKGDRRPRAEG